LKLLSGNGVKLLLDIKVSPVLDKKKVVRLTEKHGAVLDVIVGVRTIDDLKEIRSLNPNIRTLGFIKKVDYIEGFAAAGPASREELEELIVHGVSGILTAKPTIMQQLVADIRKARGF